MTVPLELLPVPNQNLEASDLTYSDSLTLNNVLRGELRRIANELEVYKDEVRNAEQKLKEFNEEQKIESRSSELRGGLSPSSHTALHKPHPLSGTLQGFASQIFTHLLPVLCVKFKVPLGGFWGVQQKPSTYRFQRVLNRLLMVLT